MDRLAVADALREVGRLLEATGAPAFRVRAYERAARSVEGLAEGEVERHAEAGTLEEIPYVGAGLAKKIARLVRTGTLPELDELRAQVPRGFRELSQVDGLGP